MTFIQSLSFYLEKQKKKKIIECAGASAFLSLIPFPFINIIRVYSYTYPI